MTSVGSGVKGEGVVAMPAEAPADLGPPCCWRASMMLRISRRTARASSLDCSRFLPEMRGGGRGVMLRKNK